MYKPFGNENMCSKKHIQGPCAKTLVMLLIWSYQQVEQPYTRENSQLRFLFQASWVAMPSCYLFWALWIAANGCDDSLGTDFSCFNERIVSFAGMEKTEQ